jgi:hypothetical protein
MGACRLELIKIVLGGILAAASVYVILVSVMLM